MKFKNTHLYKYRILLFLHLISAYSYCMINYGVLEMNMPIINNFLLEIEGH